MRDFHLCRHRFGHTELAELLAEAEDAAAAVADAVDTSAALSAYQDRNDADEVCRILSCKVLWAVLQGDIKAHQRCAVCIPGEQRCP